MIVTTVLPLVAIVQEPTARRQSSAMGFEIPAASSAGPRAGPNPSVGTGKAIPKFCAARHRGAKPTL
jgi:hypothetical protein